jgi:hypothetical protein
MTIVHGKTYSLSINNIDYGGKLTTVRAVVDENDSSYFDESGEWLDMWKDNMMSVGVMLM